MNRRALAARLALLVALSGLLPIVVVGAISIEVQRRRGERASQEALQALAKQAAARIQSYVALQKEMLRALAAAVSPEKDAERRFEDIPLDAPSLGRVWFIGPEVA